MKKIIEKYGIFLLFIIPFCILCCGNVLPDNDIWFLLNNGRYVLQEGIPHIEPFTIHEGLNYVMQQWGSSVIFWQLYNTFGGISLFVFVNIIFILLITLFYKLCYVVSGKKNISVIITTFVFIFSYGFITTRPQVFTYIILILELLLLELYIKKNNYKYLYILPLLSLLLANLHLSMWYFQFIFILPFIINGLNIKLLNKYKKDNYKLKPILIAIVFMVVFGFLNPYGIEVITFVFKSYGIEEINANITEMFPGFYSSIDGYIIIFSLIFFIFLSHINKKAKIDIRYFLFICGGTLLGVMHIKCFFYFLILFNYSLVSYLRDFSFESNHLRNKYIVLFLTISRRILIIYLPILLILFSHLSYNKYNFNTFPKEQKITEYIIDNYDISDIILYVNYDFGGYTEFMGIKSYMDPRAEVFVKRFNKKEDILKESIELEENNYFDFEKFISKYNFTHMMVYEFTDLDDYMKTRDDYEVVFSQHSEDEDNNGYDIYLYVRKNVALLN